MYADKLPHAYRIDIQSHGTHNMHSYVHATSFVHCECTLTYTPPRSLTHTHTHTHADIWTQQAILRRWQAQSTARRNALGEHLTSTIWLPLTRYRCTSMSAQVQHSCVHGFMHICTCIYGQVHVRAHAGTCMHMHMHRHIHTHRMWKTLWLHAYAYAHTHVNTMTTWIHTYTLTHFVHTCVHTQLLSPCRACIHTWDPNIPTYT